jgi:hypothetical protein
MTISTHNTSRDAYISPQRFADDLGITKRTVQRLMGGDEPKLPFVQVPDVGKMIDRGVAAEFLRKWRISMTQKATGQLLGDIPSATLRHWIALRRLKSIEIFGILRISKNSIQELFLRLEGEPTIEFPKPGDKVFHLVREVGVKIHELAAAEEQETLDLSGFEVRHTAQLAEQWDSSCSIPEAAESVEVSPSTIRIMIDQRRIQSIKVLGTVRIVRQDLRLAREEVAAIKSDQGRVKKILQEKADGLGVHLRTVERKRRRGEISITPSARATFRPQQKIGIGTKGWKPRASRKGTVKPRRKSRKAALPPRQIPEVRELISCWDASGIVDRTPSEIRELFRKGKLEGEYGEGGKVLVYRDSVEYLLSTGAR